MNRSAQKIRLNTFDDLFGNDYENIQEIELNKLHSFKNHPFKVQMNEDMNSLIESIKLNGKVLQPVLIRPRNDGEYEIISGHRRKYASEMIGFKSIPCIVKEMSDEEATVIMVDSNLSREILLPSEKAFAYKMKFDALSKPGCKMEKQAVEAIGEEESESGRNIQRYIRLTYLIPELLELVDLKKIAFIAAVDLSYLQKDEQFLLHDILSRGYSINGSQALKMKKYSQSGELNAGMMELILEKEPSKERTFKMKSNVIDKYFPDNYSNDEIEKVIVQLLEQWKTVK